MDAILVELTTGPTVEIPSGVLAARAAVAGAARDLLTVSDVALERPWPWRGDEADVRYGLYHASELVEAAGAAAARALASGAASDGDVGTAVAAPAAGRIAPATIARWDLHGVVAGLDDDILDRDPGGGEWTVRQTLGHMVSGQRGYGWYTAWWLSQRDADPFPTAVPDSLGDRLPDEHGPEMAGTPAEVMARLDATLDDSTARLSSLDDDALGARARWSGIEVDVGFRLGRWGSHLREHTIQVEKTLAMVDRAPTEVERVVRRLYEAYGRLEALVFGRGPTVMSARSEDGRTVADAFESMTAVRDSAATVRAAAEVPATAPTGS
jgi:hypothetical protein